MRTHHHASNLHSANLNISQLNSTDIDKYLTKDGSSVTKQWFECVDVFFWRSSNRRLSEMTQFPGVYVSLSSAETLLKWGGETNNRLISYYLSNISTKCYQNRFRITKVIAQTRRGKRFYRAMLCIRGTSNAPVSVSVCLSDTSRSSTKTAKRRITQTTLHDSTGILVFWSLRSPRNSTGVTPYGGTKCRWCGWKSATFDK